MSNPRQLLEAYDLFPKKKLGQNFLFDPNSLRKIIDIAQLEDTDTVLEIGPGTGSLTQQLAQHAERVISVEIDERLKPLLEDQLVDYPNVEIHWGDILRTDIQELVGERPYKVVANLPYYITSAILQYLLEQPHPPQSLTVMMQKEVAERVIAQPGDMSLLAVSVQYYGDPSIEMILKPQVFYPRPNIDSAVLHMAVLDSPKLDVPDTATFFEVVKAGFRLKRKQIKNSIANATGLSSDVVVDMLHEAGIDPMRRAETLSLEEWATLSRVYAKR